MKNTGQTLTPKSELQFEDYVGLTWSIVNKQNIEHMIENEDLFQELALVWLKCKEQYEPNKGIKFSTFYYTSAINRIMRIKERNDKEMYLWSLDYNISLTPKYELPISNLYVDDELNIEQSYINEEIIYKFLSHRYGAIAKYMLQGKTISYAADRLEVDQSTATRWLQTMIKDVRSNQIKEKT